MLDLSNLEALRAMRAQFEESTPAEEWPGAAAGELMLLADVVYALGGNDDGARQVLGEPAFTFLAAIGERRRATWALCWPGPLTAQPMAARTWPSLALMPTPGRCRAERRAPMAETTHVIDRAFVDQACSDTLDNAGRWELARLDALLGEAIRRDPGGWRQLAEARALACAYGAATARAAFLTGLGLATRR
jgi:hypothetical protein